MHLKEVSSKHRTKYYIIILGGPPPKIPSFKRGDVDRIYSEYVQVTLKAAEVEAAKSSKSDTSGNPEKIKRKYKKRLKDNSNSQSGGVSLLKPLGQQQTGNEWHDMILGFMAFQNKT